MKRITDVTELVSFNLNDDECLPITKCICGAEFSSWTFFISIYKESPYSCPKCGAKLFWNSSIHVYRVDEENYIDKLITETMEKDL